MIQLLEIGLLNFMIALFDASPRVLIFIGLAVLILLFFLARKYFFSKTTVKGSAIFFVFCLAQAIVGTEVVSVLKDLREALTADGDGRLLFNCRTLFSFCL